MKNKGQTMIMLTPAFPASEMETSWVTTQQMFVRAFQESFPEIRVIMLTFYYPERVGPYDWRGLEVYSFNGRQARRKLARIFFWRDVWRKLRALHHEHRIMGLLSFWCGECALLGHYFGRRYGIPHYCWLCGQDARKVNTLVRLIRPRPDELIAMSDFLVEEFSRNHGIRPAHMVPNAVEPAMFPLDGSGARDIDVLGVGSLSRLKQYDIFVRVAGLLVRQMPALTGVICGEGEARSDIEAQIASSRLEGRVRLAGLTPHREVLALMQRTKILLHTSSYEGFGVVCLEALYAGAHVISFCRPMKEDIPHWHIVADEDEMAAKAATLLCDPATEYGRVAPYAMKDTVSAVMQLFTQ